jgi:hypothetical protein
MRSSYDMRDYWREFSLRRRKAVVNAVRRYGMHICLILALLALVPSFLLGSWFSRPYPVRVFILHRRTLSEYVSAISRNCVDSGSGGSPYPIPASLRRCGISRVFCRGGRFYFYFGTLPPDAIEELIWCKDGIQALQIPTGSSGENLVIDLRRVDPNWFYMCRQ